MLIEALSLTGVTRPRVCVMQTALGDDLSSYALDYEAFNAAGCDVTELKLFPQPSAGSRASFWAVSRRVASAGTWGELLIPTALTYDPSSTGLVCCPTPTECTTTPKPSADRSYNGW